IQAVFPSLSCISHASFCFFCHSLDWPVKRLYGLMINFCMDPSHSSVSAASHAACQLRSSPAFLDHLAVPRWTKEELVNHSRFKDRHRIPLQRGDAIFAC